MNNEYKIRLAQLGRKISDSTILMHEAIARKVGLTGTDHKYLGIILQNGKMTAGALSNLTGLTSGAVTGVIDRLEKKKLVKRELDKIDRRKTFIIPNIEKSEKLFGFLKEDLKKRIEELIEKYDDRELQAIESYLISSIEIMNQLTHKLNNKK